MSRLLNVLSSAVLLILLGTACAAAQDPAPTGPDSVPAAGRPSAPMTEFIERYRADDDALRRFYEIGVSPTRLSRLDSFEQQWLEQLAAVDWNTLDVAGRIDAVLLAEHLAHEGRLRQRWRDRLAEAEELLSFAPTIIDLEEARWRLDPVAPSHAADTLDALADTVEALRKRVEAGAAQAEAEAEADADAEAEADADADADADAEADADADATLPLAVTDVQARRWARVVDDLAETLATWHRHDADYEPTFAWWTAEPYERAHEQLVAYAKLLREEVAGLKGEDDDPLIGDPIGREALVEDLAHEFIAYTPEQLLAIGEAQFAWCEEQMALASEELGYGDDWQAALDHVKGQFVEPGKQDELVVEQAREAIAFLDEHDLVTIPELCRETWRLRMIDREGQRTLPFAAYGGQVMLVAYPTVDMDHDAKLMSMRGNNIHFSRIVTPHELIPGHHLQGFMARRYATHRRPFGTPFLGEGWALYWELALWEAGWAKSPEDRIGMLFWRMHRAARIIVSDSFHLGRMSPEEMIDFLVMRVGHERDGATSEVRRYIAGDYGPLYQCAYMIGGLQLWALREELVDSGRMTEREFHDAVLAQNSMPIEMIRAALLGKALERGHVASWAFAGEVAPSTTTYGSVDPDDGG